MVMFKPNEGKESKLKLKLLIPVLVLLAVGV